MTGQRRTHRDGEWIDADTVAGQQHYGFQKTLSGAAPHAVVLADHGVPEMEDATYAVIPHGETTGRVTVDQSTITTLGFSLLGGADTEVVHIMVTGTPKTSY